MKVEIDEDTAVVGQDGDKERRVLLLHVHLLWLAVMKHYVQCYFIACILEFVKSYPQM